MQEAWQLTTCLCWQLVFYIILVQIGSLDWASTTPFIQECLSKFGLISAYFGLTSAQFWLLHQIVLLISSFFDWFRLTLTDFWVDISLDKTISVYSLGNIVLIRLILAKLIPFCVAQLPEVLAFYGLIPVFLVFCSKLYQL